ncbi:unnamed protein product, partial [Haemonchus placei]|uniref:Uncharacterized protein n=1 Tax=Haemonchus placei TaxID=6290 RepID=A0A0N4VZM5_HAEPC
MTGHYVRIDPSEKILRLTVLTFLCILKALYGHFNRNRTVCRSREYKSLERFHLH